MGLAQALDRHGDGTAELEDLIRLTKILYAASQEQDSAAIGTLTRASDVRRGGRVDLRKWLDMRFSEGGDSSAAATYGCL
mmetsp:Transcript_33148/g.70521  ORF Transcript_33148/g.70521 Transcript_33148/m.70521 type:complete len:80 (+) Transcript_33148:3-242(+)